MLNENNVNILIVDDLPENLLALEAVIRQEDRTVFQASSAEDALTMLLEHEFALAILDIQMPVMNGFELAKLMRGVEKTRHIPIVFVTAAGKNSDYAVKGYETGAVDLLYKPLDVQAVQSKVNVFVALYRQDLEARRQVVALEKGRNQQEALLAQFQTAQLELQKAVRMRDDFMSMVAHELCTPLTSLTLEAELRTMQLERKGTAMFDKAFLQAMVARNMHQIKGMVRLIDDMKDVTSIQSNRLSIRPVEFELSALLGRVICNLSNQAIASGSTLILLADKKVTGCWDEFRIEQVMINLLTNALRYGQGKPVEIVLSTLPGSVKIEVRDKGIGILAQRQKRIFEQFERVNKDDDTGGMGLGLFITRQLVEAHGGTLDLQSHEGLGSNFIVTLPLVRPKPASE
ncbi:MAG: hybrid sensor histidine kinase/response regulator [Polaromonas sp.]